MKSISWRPCEFGAAEAARITGMPQITERNHRRHGYLEAPRGMARHQGHGLALRFIMTVLQKRGVPPAASHRIAQEAALRVYWRALKCPGARGGVTVDEEPIQVPYEFHNDKFLAVLGENMNGSEMKWCDDLGKLFGKVIYTDEDLSAAIVLDVQRLGRLLAARVGAPLVVAVETED